MKKSNRIAIGTGAVVLIPLLLTLLAIWQWKPGSYILAGILFVGASD